MLAIITIVITIWMLLGIGSTGLALYLEWDDGNDIDIEDLLCAFCCCFLGVFVFFSVTKDYFDNNCNKVVIKGRDNG